MVHKKKTITFKLNFHKPTKMKAPITSGIKHKTNFPQLNVRTLPRVHVSLNRLMPTKMPDIAKEQYYKLVKSSGLLSVIPAHNTTWDTLSPEASPEREVGKTSRNSELLSPIIRTQLQLSPVDLDANCSDMSNEPWSDSHDPYPSPKSPEKDESSESDGWFASPTVKNPWSFEHQNVDEFLCRNPVVSCDDEVEAIMARQTCKAPKDAPDTAIHRSHPSSVLLQTFVIPLQQVDKALLSTPDVCENVSPVFGRNGIWTTPGRKLSMEKETGTVGTKDLKRKRGRPKMQGKVHQVINSVDLVKSNDEFKSPSPLVNGVKASEQENAKERESKCEEGTSNKNTELLGKKRSLEKGAAKKRGRPKKRRKLNSDEPPALNITVDLNSSNDRAKSTLLPESKEQHEIRGKEETSQRKNRTSDARVSSVIMETTFDSDDSTSHARTQVSKDVTEKNVSENKIDYLNSQIVDHSTQGPGTLNDRMPVLVDIESTSSKGSDLHSVGEVAVEQIPEEDKEQVQEIPVTTPRINKWLSAVKIESSPLIKSLELINKQNGAKSPPRATVFLQGKGEKRQFFSNSESILNINEPIQQHRLSSFRQELFPEKEHPTSVNVSSEESTTKPSMSLRPLDVRLSPFLIEDVPVLSKEERSTECLKCCGTKVSPLRDLSVVCERVPNSVLDDKNASNASVLLEKNASVENINIADEITERQEDSKPFLSFEPGCQADTGFLLPRKRELFLSPSGKDINSGQRQNKLLEGKVPLIPCSPIEIKNIPLFEGRQRKCSISSVASIRSDTTSNSAMTFTEKSNTLRTSSYEKELSKKSFGHQESYNLFTEKQSPTLCSRMSNTSLLDGTVRLTPCSPVQPVQISMLWNTIEGKKRRNSTGSYVASPKRRNSSKITSPNGFKSPVPLKDLVVKCDRVKAGDFNVLKSPENELVKLPKPKRRLKVNAENRADDKNEKERKSGKKRKKKNKSDESEKPRKKRKLGIPDHYRNYKPCQLPTIRHTNMRYRVAFNLWPRKFSDALDKINERLMNQNSFWNSLG